MIRLKKLNGLIHTLRWNGKYLICPESVADHVWGMNSLAIEFHGMLSNDLKDEIDLKELIYRISVHDIGESLYCDIPRDFKYHSVELGELINKTEDELVHKEYSDIYDDIDTAKDKSDKHGLLVALFDSIQAGLKMKSEVLLGNQPFKTEIKNSYGVLHNYINIFNETILYSNNLKQFILEYIYLYLAYLQNFEDDE